MRIKWFAAAFILLTLAAGVLYDMLQQPSLYTPPQENTSRAAVPLPKLMLTTWQGEVIQPSIMKEDVILLTFWASWCTVCLVEFPAMLELVDEMKGRVALVAVSIDDSRAQAQPFIDFLKRDHAERVNAPNVYWVWDEGKEVSLKQFNIVRTPETFVIGTAQTNGTRMIVDKIIGEYDWSGAEIRTRLRGLMAQE